MRRDSTRLPSPSDVLHIVPQCPPFCLRSFDADVFHAPTDLTSVSSWPEASWATAVAGAILGDVGAVVYQKWVVHPVVILFWHSELR